MKHFSVLAAFVVGAVVAVNVNLDIEFENFKQKFGKTYESEAEEAMRKEIFIENFEMCENHNAKYEKGEVTFTVAINHMSDLLDHEIPKGLNIPNTTHVPEIEEPNTKYVDLPYEVDWRQRGVVSRVKSQGSCGSCWAFSTTGALESHYAIAHGRLLSLSEQQLVDCVTTSKGCSGGIPYQTMQFLQQHGGIMGENMYPYNGVQGACRFHPSYAQVQVRGAVPVRPSEQALQQAVANFGPVSVAIDSRDPIFKSFHQGIYNNPACSQQPDHAVLVVGYGTDPATRQDYWLVKNSWGINFGDRGYIKMTRNRNNQCGIASNAVYPVVY